MLLRLRRLAKAVGQDATVLWYACRHPGTPLMIKLASVLLAVYIVSPLDLIPDWIPLLGWLDDVGVLALGVSFLLRFVPAPALGDARDPQQRSDRRPP